MHKNDQPQGSSKRYFDACFQLRSHVSPFQPPGLGTVLHRRPQ